MPGFSTFVAVVASFPPAEYAQFLIGRLSIEPGNRVESTPHSPCILLAAEIQTQARALTPQPQPLSFPLLDSELRRDAVVLVSVEEFGRVYKQLVGRDAQDEILLEMGEVETIRIEFEIFARKLHRSRTTMTGNVDKVVLSLSNKLPPMHEVAERIANLSAKQRLVHTQMKKVSELQEKLTAIRGEISSKCYLRWLPHRGSLAQMAIISLVPVAEAWLCVYSDEGQVVRIPIGGVTVGQQVKDFVRDREELRTLRNYRVWVCSATEWLGYLDYYSS